MLLREGLELPEDFPATGVSPSGEQSADLLVISVDSADRLFREARTANTFSSQPVTDGQLELIYELTKFGPTAMNAQPLRITLLRTDAAKERLVPLLAPANRDKTRTAPVVALLSYDIDFHEHLPLLFPHIPQLKDSLGASAERRIDMARNNAWLQAGYFIMAVRAAGLAAGPMGGYNAEGVNAEFFPAGTQQAVMVVNIGHPGEGAWQGRLPRLPYDQVVSQL